MIVRIVWMTFKEEKIEEFLNIFKENQELISGFEGCISLKLLRDIDNKNKFFTISEWNQENELENYRKSELFEKTWKKTKLLFDSKPNAWSTISMSNN
jgi:heme-degrading monooxygenase HmoA